MERFREDRLRLWRHIMAPEKRRARTFALGVDNTSISYIAHGKDDTMIVAADKLPRMFPQDAVVRVKVCGSGKQKDKTVEIKVGDAAGLRRHGIDADMVLKRVSNQELAIIEADICEFLWKQFAHAGAPGACSLHPRACRLDVHVPTVMGFSDAGVRLIPMRRFATSAGSAFRRLPKSNAKDIKDRDTAAIAVAQAMLEPLRILHALQFVHLDVKPANILMPDLDRVDGATLTDYETLMRSEDLLERVDANRDMAMYVGTMRYMSPVLSMKVPALFRAACVAAGFTPSSPEVHASRSAFDTPTVCDMHSLAMTLAELAGVHQQKSPTASPAVAKALRQILCATSAVECPDLIRGAK
jgi:hypothetical protein